jgi:hypothetical protein
MSRRFFRSWPSARPRRIPAKSKKPARRGPDGESGLLEMPQFTTDLNGCDRFLRIIRADLSHPFKSVVALVPISIVSI